MLVTRDAKRNETFYLLTMATGAPTPDDVLPFVGEVVEITGALLATGDLLELRIDSAGIRRL